MSHRTTIEDHTLNQQTTAIHSQASISVDHEDLPVGEDLRHPHQARRSSSITSTRHITNVPAEYS
jgi:hypothetical protein